MIWAWIKAVLTKDAIALAMAREMIARQKDMISDLSVERASLLHELDVQDEIIARHGQALERASKLFADDPNGEDV